MTTILDRYCRTVLQPTDGQIKYLKSKLRKFKTVVEHNGPALGLEGVRNGGSFAKKTMLRYHAEADIVFVFRRTNSLDFPSIRRVIAEVLDTQFPEFEVTDRSDLSVKVKTTTRSGRIYQFDIVPTFPVDSPFDLANVRNETFYQGISTIWHLEFVKQVSRSFPEFRRLAMLLKDWNNANDSILKSFEIELVVASALSFRERHSEQSTVDKLKECFKEVVSFVDGKPVYPDNWKYFDPDKDLVGFQRDAVMINPANPKENLAADISPDELNILRTSAIRAMSNIANNEFREVLDPNNTERDFWDRAHVSA